MFWNYAPVKLVTMNRGLEKTVADVVFSQNTSIKMLIVLRDITMQCVSTWDVSNFTPKLLRFLERDISQEDFELVRIRY